MDTNKGNLPTGRSPAEEGEAAARDQARLAREVGVLTARFATFCQDALSEGHGQDLTAVMFLDLAMSAFLDAEFIFEEEDGE